MKMKLMGKNNFRENRHEVYFEDNLQTKFKEKIYVLEIKEKLKNKKYTLYPLFSNMFFLLCFLSF